MSSSDNNVPPSYSNRGRGRGISNKKSDSMPSPSDPSRPGPGSLQNPPQPPEVDTPGKAFGGENICSHKDSCQTTSEYSNTAVNNSCSESDSTAVASVGSIKKTLRAPLQQTADKLKSPSIPHSSIGGGDGVAPSNEKNVEKSSLLNAEAAEFVPKTANILYDTPQNTTGSLNAAAAEFVPKDLGPSFDNAELLSDDFKNLSTTVPGHPSTTYPGSDTIAIDLVRESVYKLTESPGSLEDNVYLKPLVDDLNILVENDEIIADIVSIIFEQAINEPNFTYTAARMCKYLTDNLKLKIPNGCTSFRDNLLKQLNLEHAKRNEIFYLDSQRVCGLAMFFGELYLHLELIGGKKIKILGTSLVELLQTILTIPTESNMRCVLNVLKFTGAVLEDMLLEDKTGNLTPLFGDLENAAKASQSRKIQLLLQNLSELRNSNWGRGDDPSLLQSNGNFVNNKHQSAPPYTQLDPVFYGPDGKQITREQAGYEETNFYDVNQPDISEEEQLMFSEFEFDDEMDAAYEEFLQEIEAKGL